MMIITAKARVPGKNRAAYPTQCSKQVENAGLASGCLDYGFFEDAMTAGRFLFVERWRDQAAVDCRFAQSDGRDFIRAVRKRSKAASPIEIHHIVKTVQPA